MYPKPKKGLGQNFLTDKNIQRKIIFSCGLNKGDTVLEIGAGRGELTHLIAERVKRLSAVEIDSHFCAALKDKFKECPKVKIIHQDILEFNFKSYFKNLKGKISVVGNIPYYISTPIIGRLLECRKKCENIFLTVQKEFAERITASPGSKKYGALSCFVQYYTYPEILFTIKKGCFSPAPKVDSAFLHLKVPPKPRVKVKDERLFFRIIRSAFGQRRKTLRNSLAGVITQSKLNTFFTLSGLDPNIRPERLTLENFAALSQV